MVDLGRNDRVGDYGARHSRFAQQETPFRVRISSLNSKSKKERHQSSVSSPKNTSKAVAIFKKQTQAHINSFQGQPEWADRKPDKMALLSCDPLFMECESAYEDEKPGDK